MKRCRLERNVSYCNKSSFKYNKCLVPSCHESAHRVFLSFSFSPVSACRRSVSMNWRVVMISCFYSMQSRVIALNGIDRGEVKHLKCSFSLANTPSRQPFNACIVNISLSLSDTQLCCHRHCRTLAFVHWNRCSLHIAMCGQSSSSNMRSFLARDYPCVWNIDLFTDRIGLVVSQSVGWFSSCTLLCTYERYYSEVKKQAPRKWEFLARDNFITETVLLSFFGRDYCLEREREREKKKTNYFFQCRHQSGFSSNGLWRRENRIASRLFSSLGSKMNGSMRNQRSYLHGLLHYSVTLLMQVSMSLSYLVDQKQLSIYPTSLCRNPKKPVTNSERAYLSPCIALRLLGFIVRNLAAFTILQSIFQQVRLESALFLSLWFAFVLVSLRIPFWLTWSLIRSVVSYYLIMQIISSVARTFRPWLKFCRVKATTCKWKSTIYWSSSSFNSNIFHTGNWLISRLCWNRPGRRMLSTEHIFRFAELERNLFQSKELIVSEWTSFMEDSRRMISVMFVGCLSVSQLT